MRVKEELQSSSSFTLITTVRIETYQIATYSIRTLLKVDYWSPKHVELLNVLNKINHQILCILLQNDARSIQYKIVLLIIMTKIMGLDEGVIILKSPLCTYFTPLLFCVSRLLIKRVGQHVGLFCNHLDLVCNTLESHSWEYTHTVITYVGLYIIDTGLAHRSTPICQVSKSCL